MDLPKGQGQVDFSNSNRKKGSSHTAQVVEGKGGDWENEDPPTVGEDQV